MRKDLKMTKIEAPQRQIHNEYLKTNERKEIENHINHSSLL